MTTFKENTNQTDAIRVRFAPSPTGELHVGGARTALFNYLFAKKYKGSFVLRIEDTDLERGNESYLYKQIQDLLWLGLLWDEGPLIAKKSSNTNTLEEKGNFGPYRQSQRLSLYQKFAKRLIAEGKAYYCFLSESKIEEQKKSAIKNKKPAKIQSPYRDWSTDQAKEKINQGSPAVIRFKNSIQKNYILKDIVRGEVNFPSDMVGDFILIRSNNLPVYNFACAIDDHQMQISHVFRSEEHLANTLRQLMIFAAFNWKPPQFGHLSIIQGEDKKKLSKRHGAMSLSMYDKQGILPSALVNFLALLGWNPKTTQEIFSLENLIHAFSAENLNSAPAVFDLSKLEWMNHQHLKKLSNLDLWQYLSPFLKAKNLKLPRSLAWQEQAIQTLRESFSSMPAAIECFRPLSIEHYSIQKKAIEVLKWKSSPVILKQWEQALNHYKEESLTLDDFKKICKAIQTATKVKGKFLFMPLRVAIIGSPQGAELKQIVPLISRSILLARVKQVLSFL